MSIYKEMELRYLFALATSGNDDLFYFPYLPPIVRNRIAKKMSNPNWKRKVIYTSHCRSRHFMKRHK